MENLDNTGSTTYFNTLGISGRLTDSHKNKVDNNTYELNSKQIVVRATGSINRNEFHGGASKESMDVNCKADSDEEDNYLAEDLLLTQY